MIPIQRKLLRLSQLPVLALTLCATAAFAVAPTVVVDSQLTDSAGLNGPQSIVIGPNNTIYAADTGNLRVLAYIYPYSSAPTVVSMATYTLASPNALAVDSLGDLFIGDSPTTGTGRVLEALATNGVLNGTVNQVVLGGALKDVTALTVDNTPTSTTFNTLYIGDDLSSAIYTVAPGPTPTLVNLNITGIPAGYVPAALAKDTAGNLYVADFLTTLYKVPLPSVAAQPYVAPGFVLNSPTGLSFDTKGDLYILTLGVPFGTTGGTPIELVVEVPNGDPSSAFEVPMSNVGSASAIAIGSSGNLFVTDYNSGDIITLSYGSAFNFSLATIGLNGPVIGLNYEFNAPVTVRGFSFVSGGDTSTEIVNDGGTCTNGKYTDGNNGSAISPSNPFVCLQNFQPEPAYPGFRESAIELKGPGGTILNTTSVYALGYGGAGVVYPLTASTAASNINTPEGLAVSGLDKKLYIVNAAPGASDILSANGPDGKTLTTVNTTPLGFGIPIGIAIDGAGDLYVADFAYGVIDVIPAAVSGITPYTENAGGLLQHPYSVALDPLGNLYIGDTGPEGSGADAADPGYIVEVPANGGAPFKINTGTTTIIYPESLVVDPFSDNLYVGDGGDTTEAGAKVVEIAAANGAVTDVTPSGVTQPVGLALDPADQLYVLDQNANTITVVPPTGTPYLLPFDNSLFTTPAGLAITSGGQSLVESNVGPSTSNNLVYLNGDLSTLAFGSVTVGQQSNTMTATVGNIGNTTLDFLTPYYTSNRATSPFDILGSTTCENGGLLYPTSTCAINIQFKPTARGSSTEKLTLSTNGYNNGDSVIDLSGTGAR